MLVDSGDLIWQCCQSSRFDHVIIVCVVTQSGIEITYNVYEIIGVIRSCKFYWLQYVVRFRYKSCENNKYLINRTIITRLNKSRSSQTSKSTKHYRSYMVCWCSRHGSQNTERQTVDEKTLITILTEKKAKFGRKDVRPVGKHT